jgi:hypothetical protein
MLPLTDLFSYGRSLFILLLFLLPYTKSFGQKETPKNAVDTTKPFIPVDSLTKNAPPVTEHLSAIDSVMKYHSPRKATIRSAILPGLGQIYNKKYWKVPIIYGALGVTTVILVYNVTNYRDLRYAYTAKIAATKGDTSMLAGIEPNLVPLDLGATKSYRDEFRKNVDYTVLAFLVLWGLNIVDATVDAHLKTFDVSPDLSLRFKLGPSEMAKTNGVSLVLAFK